MDPKSSAQELAEEEEEMMMSQVPQVPAPRNERKKNGGSSFAVFKGEKGEEKTVISGFCYVFWDFMRFLALLGEEGSFFLASRLKAKILLGEAIPSFA